MEYTIGHVTSNDGTRIGYRQLGTGPGVILVHGGMMASQNFIRLAQFLSDAFTVYIPDRRGRGLSGPFGPNYSIKAESEDLQALINKTAADKIFGLSSGAICVLQTATTEPALKKVVLYEPPIPVQGINNSAWGPRYESALAKGNLGKAFITIMKGTGDPSLFTALPGFLTAPLLNLGIKSDAKKTTGDIVSLKALMPTMHYDLMLIRESPGIIARCKNIGAEVLLMGGTKSQRYLKPALDTLNTVLPQAKRITLEGLGHIAANNDDNPERVARELRTFFLSGSV